MTCKDCIHYPACKSCWCAFWEHQELTEDDNCKLFKNKSDYAEVRCKNCKHYVANYCTRDIKGRTNMFYMTENDFCSYGEKKEGAD